MIPRASINLSSQDEPVSPFRNLPKSSPVRFVHNDFTEFDSNVSLAASDRSFENLASPDRSQWQGKHVAVALEALRDGCQQGDPKALLERGKIHLKQRNWDGAIVDLKQIKNREAAELLSMAYDEKGCLEYVKENYTDALVIFSQSISFNHKNTNALYHRGLAYQKLNFSNAADENFETVLKYNNKYIHAWCGRAEIAMARKNYDDAIKFYKQAHDLNPASVHVRDLLIIAYEEKAKEKMRDGKLVDAMSTLNQSLQIFNKNPDTFILLGRIHFLKNEFKQSLNYYDAAITLDKYNSFALAGKGEVLLKQNHLEDAMVLFEKAYKYEPYDELVKALLNQVYKLLAIAHGKKKEFTQAYIYDTCALKLFPDDIDTLSNRGVMNYEMGRYWRAIDDFHQVLKTNGMHQQSLTYLGASLGKVRQFAEGIKTLKKADQKDPLVKVKTDEIFHELGKHLHTLN